MDLDKIKEVKETLRKETANELLKKGWVLLDVKAVQLSKPDGTQKSATSYILGMPEKDYAKKRLNEHLFREYQSTGQLRYQTQTLNGRMVALVMAAIFLLLGFSLSNLTESTKKTFEYYFPFVAVIVISAFGVWAAWYIYMTRVQEQLTKHEINLEKKLGFHIQVPTRKAIDEEIIPRSMPILRRFPSIRYYWPFWFTAGLAIMLGSLYSAVVWSTHVSFFCLSGLIVIVMVFLVGYSGIGLMKLVGAGLARILLFLVEVVRWIVGRKKKPECQHGKSPSE